MLPTLPANVISAICEHFDSYIELITTLAYFKGVTEGVKIGPLQKVVYGNDVLHRIPNYASNHSVIFTHFALDQSQIEEINIYGFECIVADDYEPLYDIRVKNETTFEISIGDSADVFIPDYIEHLIIEIYSPYHNTEICLYGGLNLKSFKFGKMWNRGKHNYVSPNVYNCMNKKITPTELNFISYFDYDPEEYSIETEF